MIDLLVCNFNTRDKLQRLVETLYNSTPDLDNRIWRLYLADNDSTDDSRDWIAANKHLFDGIDLNENIGYAAAINAMAAETNSSIIGCLNADTWFSDSNILAIQKSFDDHSETAILGPKQRDENGYITSAGIFGSLQAPKHRDFHGYDPEDKLYRDRCRAITVAGSAYFVRRKIWDSLTNCSLYQEVTPGALGAFLETFHYWDETFMSYHAWAHDYEVWYDGECASIGHSWHAASPKQGAIVDQSVNIHNSRELFRKACDHHQIPHD